MSSNGDEPVALRERVGICQWFHFNDHQMVEESLVHLRELGIRRLRTGISWADFCRDGGERWYDWLLPMLSRNGLELLVSVWHTPPSISEGGSCSSPPIRLRDYADFIDHLITRYGEYFESIELWNEPNNRLKWDFRRFDPDWRKFGEMVGSAAYWARRRGKRTVLGGMIPVDHHWLNLMKTYQAFDHFDVIGIHGFPGMWTGAEYWWDWPDQWRGWHDKIAYIAEHCPSKPIWVTECGLDTLSSNGPERKNEQIKRLFEALLAPVQQVYWYCLRDLHSARSCIEETEDNGRIEQREYHLGLLTSSGEPKPAYTALKHWLLNGIKLPISHHAHTRNHQTAGVRNGTE